jgi:hypothetical protein
MKGIYIHMCDLQMVIKCNQSSEFSMGSLTAMNDRSQCLSQKTLYCSSLPKNDTTCLLEKIKDK